VVHPLRDVVMGFWEALTLSPSAEGFISRGLPPACSWFPHLWCYCWNYTG